MKHVLVNGNILKREAAQVDIEDRGYQFGDGIYEVIRVYQGQLFLLKEHLERFFRSAKEIKINVSYTAVQLEHFLKQIVHLNQLEEGIVYVQLTRGTAPRVHQFPANNIAAQLVAYTKEMKRPGQDITYGVKAILAEDIRWLRCDIKSLNLLGNVLAKQQATEEGCYEAILHRGQIVTEGSSSNVFMVKNKIMYTHPATELILNGITRQEIIQDAAKLGLELRETAFTIEQLLAADEVMVTNTVNEITPVIQINQTSIGQGVPGSITQQLQKEFVTKISKNR